MNSSDNNPIDNPELENNSSVRKVHSPGSMLRQKRESGNLELNTIARELNLDPWMLTALEADDFSKFGAQVFAKGHLKHYAQHLGLKPDDVLFAYYQVAERKETTPVISKHLSSATTNKSYNHLSKWFIRILALLAIAALAYGLYQGILWWLNDAKESSSSVTELSLEDTSSSQVGLDSVATAAPVANNTRAEIDTDLQADTATINNEIQDASSSNTAIEPGPVENTAQSAATTLSDIPATSTPAVSERQQLRFTFQQSSWIEVFSESGDRLIYGMANEGTVRNIRINGPTEIFLGNSDGTVITLNGQLYTIPNNAKAGRTARFVLDPDF